MKFTSEQRNRIVYAMRAAPKSKNSDWYIEMLTAGTRELAGIMQDAATDTAGVIDALELRKLADDLEAK
jgi:hypothetical protein